LALRAPTAHPPRNYPFGKVGTITLQTTQRVGRIVAESCKATYIVSSFIPTSALRSCLCVCSAGFHLGADHRLHIWRLTAEVDEFADG